VKSLRAVLQRLDPWAALVIGVLIALAVVILLATPGPWLRVVGPAPPVGLVSPPPADVALFVLADDTGACTGVVWVHVDHTRKSLTATVVESDTQGTVPGGGLTSLRRTVDDAGPEAAAGALGAALGVEMDAWAALDRQALRAAVPTMFPVGEDRTSLKVYRRATAAWAVRADPARRWPEQYAALREALPRVQYEQLKVVAFSNYILGFGVVRSDLDLQGATSLAATLGALQPSQVRVRAAAALVETCRGARVWSVDGEALEPVREALSLGLVPPALGPTVSYRSRPARVLVVTRGGGPAAGAYVGEVRRRLRRSAGAPVAVRSLAILDAAGSADRVMAVVDEWGPLAVLLAPPLSSAAPPADELAAAFEEVAVRLQQRGQPAVISAPLPEADESRGAARQAALTASGLPVSPLSGLVAVTAGAPEFGTVVRAREAARANVETLVHACWPGALAPGLASTRLGVSFAAARRTAVAVVGPATAELAAARLRLWGYQAAAADAGGWEGGLLGRAVYYHEGRRRAALALAGDLGLPRSAVVVDEEAPAEVTLDLRQ